MKITKKQKQVLDLLERPGVQMTLREMAMEIGISTPGVSARMEGLRKKGAIKRHGLRNVEIIKCP